MSGFAIFWRQHIGKKCDHKMLMKLAPVHTIFALVHICKCIYKNFVLILQQRKVL